MRELFIKIEKELQEFVCQQGLQEPLDELSSPGERELTIASEGLKKIYSLLVLRQQQMTELREALRSAFLGTVSVVVIETNLGSSAVMLRQLQDLMYSRLDYEKLIEKYSWLVSEVQILEDMFNYRLATEAFGAISRSANKPSLRRGFIIVELE